jgi:hypothetical protein
MQPTVGPVGPRGQNFRGSGKWRLCVRPNDRQTFLLLEAVKNQISITDRIRNKIWNGNLFPKFSINRKEQKFLPICLRLLTLLTIIKDPSLRGLRGNQDRQKFDFWQPQAVKMGQLSLRRGLNLEKSTHYLSIYLENKKAKRSAYEKERRPARSFNRKWKDKMNKQMTTWYQN